MRADDAPQLAGIGRAELGPHAGTLVDERQTILAAIEFLGFAER
jgi:hypothetical protein